MTFVIEIAHPRIFWPFFSYKLTWEVDKLVGDTFDCRILVFDGGLVTRIQLMNRIRNYSIGSIDRQLFSFYRRYIFRICCSPLMTKMTFSNAPWFILNIICKKNQNDSHIFKDEYNVMPSSSNSFCCFVHTFYRLRLEKWKNHHTNDNTNSGKWCYLLQWCLK